MNDIIHYRLDKTEVAQQQQQQEQQPPQKRSSSSSSRSAYDENTRLRRRGLRFAFPEFLPDPDPKFRNSLV